MTKEEEDALRVLPAYRDRATGEIVMLTDDGERRLSEREYLRGMKTGQRVRRAVGRIARWVGGFWSEYRESERER